MKLVVTDGGKGGVGKSHLAIAVADRLRAVGARLAVLDGDVVNPDVCRVFQDGEDVTAAILDLSDERNFTEMFSALESLQGAGIEYAVLSCPAGISSIEDLRAIAAEALEALDIEVVTLFVLSKLPDSVHLAGRSLERGFASVASSRMAILNGLHGHEEDFVRWRESSERKEWMQSGGKEAHVRELYHRVVDALRDNALAPSDLLTHLNTIHRIQLGHWLREFDERVMRPLGLPCPPPTTAAAAASNGKAAEKKEAAA